MTRTQLSLGLDPAPPAREPRELSPGAVLLPGFALPAGAVLRAIHAVLAEAPLRHLIVPRGLEMSVAMSNCGALGWFSDVRGYRYTPTDPASGRPWPAMPDVFLDLAVRAAAAAGYPDFQPKACLVNRYDPGARMGLHQDRDESDLSAPIVSVSLGLPATFLWGGPARTDRPTRIPVVHGDVVVFGGPGRLRFHGVAPVKEGDHPEVGPHRFNLTFRKVS